MLCQYLGHSTLDRAVFEHCLNSGPGVNQEKNPRINILTYYPAGRPGSDAWV